MASTNNNSSDATPTAGAPRARAELREIPLSQIVVAEGFNPRGEVVEDDELRAMAETMRQFGCLQPIRVQATEAGDFVLVAGERRYRAAALAALTDLPASVLPVGAAEDEGVQLKLLVEAMIENELRTDLNSLQRAQGYQAMIDGGLSVRGVAESLGGKARHASRERRVREHLMILSLPQDIAKLVAQEQIPLLAVKRLAELAAIHEDLARAAAGAVLNPPEGYEQYTWAEVLDEPLATAVAHCEELPAGLFSSALSYLVERFGLSEKAQQNLAAFEKLTGERIRVVHFTHELVEQARALGAVFECSWFVIIKGQDVADRLAEDYIAMALKEQRALRRRPNDAASTGSQPDASLGVAERGEPGPQESPAEARAACEAAQGHTEQQQQRERALAFNLDLGLLAFKHLPKIKVDQRVLRILASVDFGGSLNQIAARGARLAMPGWVTPAKQRNGKTKTIYLEGYGLELKAKEFLDGAQSAGDIAGRALTLLALASLADQNAIAGWKRSGYSLCFDGPWAQQARRDLNAVIRERITEGQLPALDDLLAERVAEDEQAERVEAEGEQARLRLIDITARLGQLEDGELDQALADATLAWGEHALKSYELKGAVKALRGRRARLARDGGAAATAEHLAEAA